MQGSGPVEAATVNRKGVYQWQVPFSAMWTCIHIGVSQSSRPWRARRAGCKMAWIRHAAAIGEVCMMSKSVAYTLVRSAITEMRLWLSPPWLWSVCFKRAC